MRDTGIYKELKNFAQWFNQDFGVLFKDIELGTNTYLETLSEEQKVALSKEIGLLLKEYPGKDHKGLKKAWLKLGAQWWSSEHSPTMLERLAAYPRLLECRQHITKRSS